MGTSDGGQAFPHMPSSHIEKGMTLRDYFASQALASFNIRVPMLNNDADVYAQRAYAIADAMLRAREGK